ncbi:hypothetical protein Tco_1151653 [Tanacetum coccineum]
MLRTQMLNSLVVLNEPEGSDDYTEVTYDKEQCLSDHYTAPVTPSAYTPFLPFLATMEPTYTLLIGDEVINIIPERDNNEFIKSSVNDLVPILRESKVTSVYDDLECDMPITIFWLANLSLTKGMSDEPLGDDSKSISYDVTFSNPLFDFNDDSTLCYDNMLFDEEFKDISRLDPPKSAQLNYEPLGNPDSVSRSIKTSNLILEELVTEISLDDLIPTKIDDGYYDSEGDILFLEHLLIEETFFDPSPAVLPKNSTLLVTSPPASKQFSLREVERFNPFFSLT